MYVDFKLIILAVSDWMYALIYHRPTNIRLLLLE